MVMLNFNWRYWDPAENSDVVGWPHPKLTTVGWRNPVAHAAETTLWPYQQITQQIPGVAAAGYLSIVLPPSCLGAAGIFSGGYDKNNDYVLDGTAFGSAEMLRQCIATAHAHGLQVYGDLVLHQYDGGHDGVYDTKRFPKTPQCFAAETTPGGVEADPVPDTNGNFPFGDLSAYVHAEPPGYMHAGAIAAAQWLTATTGFDGYRIDEAKGTNAQVIYDILHSPGLIDKEAYFEYFDGTPGPVENYVNGYQKRRGSVLDFATKFNLGNICNNQGRVWMGQMAGIGYCTTDPAMATTFVESADTDTSIGQQTIWNKMLAYAAVLTYPGKPQVYYRDRSSDTRCYGLQDRIDNLVYIWRMFAKGDFIPRLDTNSQVFAMERLGTADAPGCLVFFNNDPDSAHTVTVPTSLAPDARLHEYTGNNGYNSDLWIGWDATATVTVPRNVNGLSYLVFALWTDAALPALPAIETTQTLYGAGDLKPGALTVGTNVVGRVSVAAKTKVRLSLITAATGAAVGVLGPDGTVLAAPFWTTEDGFHTLTVTLPATSTGSSDYALAVTYQAPLVPVLEVAA